MKQCLKMHAEGKEGPCSPSSRAVGLILPWRASSRIPLSSPAGDMSGQNVARLTASLGRTTHILSYVMLGKAECRPSKPEVFILFMWLHSQLWHCKWRKGRGKGCFLSKMQTQRYYPPTDFNLPSQILMCNSIQATDVVPPSLPMLSGFLTLLSNGVGGYITASYSTGTRNVSCFLRSLAACRYKPGDRVAEPQNPSGSLHHLKRQR